MSHNQVFKIKYETGFLLKEMALLPVCTSTSVHTTKWPFIEECLTEMDKVVLRHMSGEPPNPLERLAIQLLKESAYLEE